MQKTKNNPNFSAQNVGDVSSKDDSIAQTSKAFKYTSVKFKSEKQTTLTKYCTKTQ